MKDIASRVIYVGKAKKLRSRAGSYFLKAAQEDQRTASWVGEIADIDYLEAESEVDALLMESRLIKDIQPKFNKELKDDKSFPYLMITTREEFPRVELTREPRTKGVKLYGPFTSAGALRGHVRSCSVSSSFERAHWISRKMMSVGVGFAHVSWQVFSSAQKPPCNLRISKEDYRRDIRRLQTFLDGGKKKLLNELRKENATVQ